MNPLVIEGVTRFEEGIAIVDDIMDDGTRIMGTAWEPTPDELDRINRGASIQV